MNKGVFCLFEKPTLRTKGKCNREMFPFAVAQVCAIPTDTCTAPIDQTGVEVSAVQLPVFGDAQKYQIRGFSLKCLSSCTSVSQHYLQTVAETTLRSTQEGFWGSLALKWGSGCFALVPGWACKSLQYRSLTWVGYILVVVRIFLQGKMWTSWLEPSHSGTSQLGISPSSNHSGGWHCLWAPG